MLKIAIGSKSYLPWSKRPWLALRANHVPFDQARWQCTQLTLAAVQYIALAPQFCPRNSARAHGQEKIEP